MGFLSGLVSAIGGGINDVENFFTGNNKKKQQQNQNQPSNQSNNNANQSSGPQLSVQPLNNQNQTTVQAQAPAQIQAPVDNGINLNFLNKQPDAATLVKATQKPTVQLPTQDPNLTTMPVSQPGASILHDITHNPVTNFVGAAGRDSLNALEGVGAAIGRAGTGAVEGTIQLPSIGAHLGDTIARKISPQQVLVPYRNDPSSPFTEALDKATQTVTNPIDNLNRQIDQSANTQTGAIGKAVYKPAQVVANVAAAVPGIADLAGTLLSKAGKGESTLANVLSKASFKGPKAAAADASVAPAQNEVASGVIPTNTDVPRTTPPPFTEPATPPQAPAMGPNGEEIAQVSHEAPNAVQPSITPDDPVRTHLENTANDIERPTYQRTAAKNQLSEMDAAQKQAVEDASNTGPTALDRPTAQPNQAIKDVIQKGNDELNYFVNEHQDATPQELEAAKEAITSQVTANVNKLQEARYGKGDSQTALAESAPKTSEVPVEALPVKEQPPVSTEPPVEKIQAPAPTAPEKTQPAKTTTDAPKITETTPEQTKSPPVDDTNPAPERSPDTKTAPNAPKGTKALQRKLSESLDGVKKDHEVHDVLTRKEVTDAGNAVVDTMEDKDVLSKYADPLKFNNKNDMAIGNASLNRLEKIAKTGSDSVKKQAQNAINNIIDAAAEVKSQAGDTLNYGQEMFKNLGPESKAAYYIKKIDKENLAAEEAQIAKNGGKLKGEAYKPLADDPDRADAVHSKFSELFAKEESLKAQQVEHSATGAKGVDAATRGDVTVKQLQDAINAKEALQIQRQQNGGDIADYYKSLVPENQSLGQKIGDVQRTGMLSSPEGRVNGIAGTGLTVLDKGVKQGLGGLLGKASNALFKTKFSDSGMNAGEIGRGFKGGVQKTGQLIKGQSYVDDPEAILSGTTTSLNKLSDLPTNNGNLLTRTVKASVAGHQNLSSGVYRSEILRQTRAAGIAEGLKGQELDKYAIGHAINPSEAVQAKAQLLHDTLNNVQKNPITDALTFVAKGLNRIPVVGGLIKNQTIPFSHFLGGNIWNSITDRNLIAAGSKFVVAAGKAATGKGDGQAVIDALANTGVEATKAYALGWFLTQHGIVTNKDAQGNSYEGAYIHFGNRSFPVTSLGAFAPSILLGNATYNGFHDQSSPNQDLVSKVARSVGDTLSNAYRSYSGQQLLGSGTTLAGPFNQAFGKGGVNNFGALAKVGTNVLGQFVPAIAGDTNALLNNGVPGLTKYTDGLNKTHEAADTKVLDTNSKSGKKGDLLSSAGASLLNKVPGLSQTMLARKAGVSAGDSFDRLTKGDHANGAEIQAAAVKQSQADQIAAFAKDSSKTIDPIKTDPAVLKAVDTANKKAFEKSGKQSDTINGNLYERNVKGGTTVTSAADHAFQTSQGNVDSVQRGIDQEQFKQSGKQQDTINGVVYQRSDDGKVTGLEQKDYDYQQADNGMKDAQKAQDYTGYKQHSTDLLKNISDQLQNPNLSASQKRTLVNTGLATQEKAAEYDHYNGFKNTDPKNVENFKPIGQLNNARSDWTQQIQEYAVKHNVDAHALLSVASQEGLGGGVGDGGHAFGPFQMNDAGGVLTGKYASSAEAQKYAESPAGIEDAVKQIAGVAGGLKGKAAIEAIVNKFERPADPTKEIAGANETYDGGTTNMSSNGSGTSVISDADKAGKAGSAASNLLKSNTIGNLGSLAQVSLGGLAPAKVTSTVPILQKILPGDLIKKRTISVANVHA